MPHELVTATGHDRHRSLGWLATAWIEHFCVHGPGDVQGEPVVHTDEYTAFVVDCYALEGDGRRFYDSAFLSRPKGCDKSGLGARLAMFEALGPCRFAGWATGGEVYEDPWGLGFRYVYRPGEPMGRPVTVPFIRCMATEEGQTGNVYDVIWFNLTHGPLAQVPGIDPGLTRTFLPGGGEITPSTASSASKDGGKETYIVLDESHLYNTPELRRMYATVTRNLRKRKKIAETWYLETTTMYAAGEDSVAEATYKLAELIRAGQDTGKARVRRERLLLDHRWGVCADMGDEKELTAAIAEAYGDALAWNHLPSIVDEFYDPRAHPADSARYFLNAQSAAPDAWIVEPEWSNPAICHPEVVVADRDVITVGFDGSRRRARGVTDATALIGCRVSDGHLFEIGVWEQPSGPAGDDWQVPVGEVDRVLGAAFKRWTVVGFFADPAKWETKVAEWESRWGSKLKVKATREHPIEWWMTGGRSSHVVKALEQFHNAVIDGGLSHSGESVLSRHVLNARRRPTRSGLQIAKEHPDSARKIDAAVAAVLAHEARLKAVAKGEGSRRRKSTPQKVR